MTLVVKFLTIGLTIGKEFGIEIAKAATGHAHISTTQIYGERDLDAAKKVAIKFG